MELAPSYPTMEERESEYRVHVDVMGADPEDITIDVREGYVDVYAERRQEVASESAFRQAAAQVFHSIPVPDDVDVGEIGFAFERGHLDLILPKA